MKRVLHFITGLEDSGGAENMLLKTIPYIKDTENRVCVVYGRGAIGKKLEQRGIIVYYLDVKSFFDFSVFKKYKKVMSDFNPDIQVNYLIQADIFARIFAKIFGAKKVVSYIRNKYKKSLFIFLDKITLKKVDYLLANSKTVLDVYREKYDFIREKSGYIPNGVVAENFLPQFNKNELKKELGIEENDFVIVNIGSLHEQKDHPTLLRAINILKEKRIKNLKLFICGEGERERGLIKLRDELGLANEVSFLGIRRDKYEILSIANLFVLPSRYEGMSNALLEAMNTALPLVVSDIPENRELIKNNIHGFTFKTGNVDDLVEKMSYLINDREKGKIMGAEARKRIVKKYDIRKVIEDLNNFLKDF